MSNSPSKGQLLLEEAKQAYMQGASDVEVARILNVTLKRFYEMVEEIPDFAAFVEKGRTLSQAWWYEQARKNLWNKEFNTPLWNFNMKNRYGWADKVDTADKTDRDDVNVDQIKGQLAAYLKRIAKTHPDLVSGLHLNSLVDGESNKDD